MTFKAENVGITETNAILKSLITVSKSMQKKNIVELLKLKIFVAYF